MTISGPDAGLDKVKLNGLTLSANLLGAVVGDPTIRRTIEGASEVSITVSDPAGDLRREEFLNQASRILVDDLRFTLVKVAKSGDDLTLTGEDEVIYYLRQKTGPKKAFREKITRAQFVKGLVRDALGDRVRFYSPELLVKQPIASSGRATAAGAGDPAPGISRDARGLTVKGVAATLAQKKIADQVIRLAMEYDPPRRAVVALLTACIVESVMGTYGMTYSTDGDSIGLLQARTTYVSRKNALSIPYNVRRFMVEPWTGTPLGGAIKQAQAGRAPGDIAQSIQGSAYPDRYAIYVDEANEWIDAYFGGQAGDFGGGGGGVKPYAFEVKKGEDYWTAIKRLAEEVNWRAFVVGRTFYFVAEPTLLQGKRQMNVRDRTRGIDQVDWDVDVGRKADTATITGRSGDWRAAPGTVAELDESHGPAAGRWIVSEIEGALTNTDVTITLKRPSKPKPEPAPEQVEQKTDTGGVTGGAGSLSQIKFESFESGSPYWGGARAFFNQLLKPWVEENYGFPISSEKRSYNTGSGLSDHYVGSTLAYAVDWSTSSGESCARRIADLLGASYSPGAWNSSTIQAGGRSWTVQILWAAPDGTHYDHVHVGIHRQ